MSIDQKSGLKRRNMLGANSKYPSPVEPLSVPVETMDQDVKKAAHE